LCKLSRQCIVSDLREYSLAWALLLTWWGAHIPWCLQAAVPEVLWGEKTRFEVVGAAAAVLGIEKKPGRLAENETPLQVPSVKAVWA